MAINVTYRSHWPFWQISCVKCSTFYGKRSKTRPFCKNLRFLNKKPLFGLSKRNIQKSSFGASSSGSFSDVSWSFPTELLCSSYWNCQSEGLQCPSKWASSPFGTLNPGRRPGGCLQPSNQAASLIPIKNAGRRPAAFEEGQPPKAASDL